MHIANGTAPGILQSIVNGEPVGTRFLPQKSKHGIKRWIAHSEGLEKGAVVINEGAITALTSPERASSLLPVGITSVEGTFSRGDIIRVCTEDGTVVGYGMATCNDEKARATMGQKGLKPVIHYDYLYIVP